MFRSRRRAALRRLLEGAAGDGGAPRLADAQLEALAAAAEGGPGARAACALAPRAAAVAACRAWRWPELRDARDLRRLPDCRSPPAADADDLDCCNPYHWSKLCKPESPPPPYCRFAMDDKLKPEDRAPSEEDCRRTDHERLAPGSLTTDGEEKLMWEREWCRLAYWELARRVGRQYGVRPAAVDVFGGGAAAAGPRDGLCLDTLAGGTGATGATGAAAPYASPQPPAQPHAQRHADSVTRTRAKIGLGVTLSLEADGVWLYNRSEAPVFVNSPALDEPAARALLVYRVPPGHCLCVFEPRGRPPAPRRARGPVDPDSVRISFAKGWGPKYSRQDVTACPCWLEVLLAPRR